MYLYILIAFGLVNNIHSWNSTLYANISNFQYDSAINFINQIKINTNSAIIDIGCGNGKITYYIASNVTNNNVTGIDSSESMISYAKNNYIKENLEFINADISKFNTTNKYDVILSFFCIPWIKNKKDAFINIANLCNHNSKIYILGALFEKNHVELINNITEKSHWKEYYINYTSPFEYLNDNNYEMYAANAGITVRYKEVYDITYKFENRDKLFGFNLAILPHIKHLDDKNKIKFVNELLDDYFDFIGKEDYMITFTFIKFIGIKY